MKLQKRRDAYWGMVKNNGHSEVYKRQIAEEPLVLPRYLQKKPAEMNPKNKRK